MFYTQSTAKGHIRASTHREIDPERSGQQVEACVGELRSGNGTSRRLAKRLAAPCNEEPAIKRAAHCGNKAIGGTGGALARLDR